MFTGVPSGLYFLLSVLFRAFLAGVLSGFLHSTFFFHFFYPIHFLMFPRVFRYVFSLFYYFPVTGVCRLFFLVVSISYDDMFPWCSPIQ